MRFMPLQMPHALTSHLSPTLLPVECTAKRSTSVVQSVPSVYGLAPRDYRHTLNPKSYIRNGWASNIINPDKTMHSGSAPSLSDIASASVSANVATETIVPEWKNIEN